MEVREKSFRCFRWTLSGQNQLTQAAQSLDGIQLKLIEQEVVGVHRIDLVWCKRLGVEVPEVRRHDDGSLGAHRSCQDMPIFRVVGHCWDQRLIAVDQGVRESDTHRADASGSFGLGEIELAHEVAFHLAEDVVGPERPVGTCLSQPQQEVGQPDGDEDTSVEERGKRHS